MSIRNILIQIFQIFEWLIIFKFLQYPICIFAGSNGHEMYKRLTATSLLDGVAMLTSFCSLQFVTEYKDQTVILHKNKLLGAADQVRPYGLWAVPESPGESKAETI